MPKKLREVHEQSSESLSPQEEFPVPTEFLIGLLKSSEETQRLLRQRNGSERDGGGVLSEEAHLPRHKCKDKGSIVGEGNGKGESWYYRTASRAAAIKEAQDAADQDAKDQAKADAGMQMPNVICQTGCQPKFDTAHPVITIVCLGTPVETAGTLNSTYVACTAAATYEIPWECA